MELHNNSICYAFPYQNMEFHITKILKEIIAAFFYLLWRGLLAEAFQQKIS